MTETPESNSQLSQALDIHSPMWMSMPGVVAVGLGEDCLKVFYSDERALKETTIPDEVENLKVVKVVSGRFASQ